jgi:hypothetical protein
VLPTPAITAGESSVFVRGRCRGNGRAGRLARTNDDHVSGWHFLTLAVWKPHPVISFALYDSAAF